MADERDFSLSSSAAHKSLILYVQHREVINCTQMSSAATVRAPQSHDFKLNGFLSETRDVHHNILSKELPSKSVQHDMKNHC